MYRCDDMSKGDIESKLKLYYTGRVHKVYCLCDGTRNTVKEFLDGLKVEAFDLIHGKIIKTADEGYDLMLKLGTFIRKTATKPKIPKFECTQAHVRILFCMSGNDIVMLVPYKKDNNKNSKEDNDCISRAQKLIKKYSL